MDLKLYRAAQDGDWVSIGKLSENLDEETANGSNLLHVLAQTGGEACGNAAKQILARKPKLALRKNGDGETPLVIASRRGHSEVVRELIANGSNRTENNRVAAIIEAVRSNRYDVVKLFVEQMPAMFGKYMKKMIEKERQQIAWIIQSPLYLSIEKGHQQIATLILSNCKSISYHGPNGRTAFHAAAITNSTECTKMLLEKMHSSIIPKKDARGWTALHYAAKLNHPEIVKLLLSKDPSMGYISSGKDDSYKTALHVAVINGHLDVVTEILSHCPQCWEMTTGKRQNILHLAIANERGQVLEFILSTGWASELVNKKDADENTPLHLYASTKSLGSCSLLNHPCLDKNPLNKQGLTPLDMVAGHNGKKLTKRQVWMQNELAKSSVTSGSWWMAPESKKPKTLRAEFNEESERGSAYMVVATLIITVAFAAGFTLPGGYDTSKGKEGMAVLQKKAAFLVFIVSDALAMVLSVYSVLLRLATSEKGPIQDRLSMLRASKVFIVLSMTSLVVAFVSGLIAVIPVAPIKIYLVAISFMFLAPLPFYLFRLVFQAIHRPSPAVLN